MHRNPTHKNPMQREAGPPGQADPRASSASPRGPSASRLRRRKLRTLNGSIPRYSKPAAASAAQGSATSTAAKMPVPSNSGSTYSAGTLKFLKLHTGSVDTSSSAVPASTRAQNNGYSLAANSQSQPSERASSPTNNGNNANPAPAGAGTPVKKL